MCVCVFKILFLERGEGSEKERERNIDWTPQPGTRQQPRHLHQPRIEPETFCFAGYTQATEPHWPGLRMCVEQAKGAEAKGSEWSLPILP